MEHRQTAPYQYSRPQRSAVAHGFDRRLVFDDQQYLEQPFSLVCSDLKNCYDIIVHSAASLVLQRERIPLPSIIRMLDTIQRISHKLRIAYGDSNLTHGDDTISDKFRHFMIGRCQGNSCAPQLW